MRENSIAVTKILEAYKKAVFEKDVDAFMLLYDKDARIFDTWGVWLFEGSDARLPVIQGWLGSLGSKRVIVNFDDVLVTSNHEIAIVTAVGTYSAISIDGVKLRSMQNRFTWALKLVDDSWRIIHEHTSVPIANDLTATLIRD